LSFIQFLPSEITGGTPERQSAFAGIFGTAILARVEYILARHQRFPSREKNRDDIIARR
jgi:hypothetical protein